MLSYCNFDILIWIYHVFELVDVTGIYSFIRRSGSLWLFDHSFPTLCFFWLFGWRCFWHCFIAIWPFQPFIFGGWTYELRQCVRLSMWEISGHLTSGVLATARSAFECTGHCCTWYLQYVWFRLRLVSWMRVGVQCRLNDLNGWCVQQGNLGFNGSWIICCFAIPKITS